MSVVVPITPTLPPLAEVLDLVPDAVCVVDGEGRYLFVNASYERIFGYRRDEMLGRNMLEVVHPDDRPASLEAAARVMDGIFQPHFRNRCVRKDGRIVDIQWSASWSPENAVRIAVGHEITELRRAEVLQSALLDIAEAANAEIDLPSLLARIHALIAQALPVTEFRVALLQPDGRTLTYPYWSGTGAAGSPPARALKDDALIARAVGSEHTVLAECGDVPAGCLALAVPLIAGHSVIGALEIRCRADDDTLSPSDRQHLEIVASQIATAHERYRYRRKLEHLANHDTLTGLLNRHRLQVELEYALAMASETTGRIALLYIDLDGFKAVNDTCGHEGGDQLLQEVAQRLQDAVARADLVARIGGDEFAVLLPSCESTAAARAVADGLRDAVRLPYRVGEFEVCIDASVGIACYPEDGATPEDLLRHADSTMYGVKRGERRPDDAA
jgi:diguanylate cyclase (GGDEF)-like protein/PAS domain S-box-containing protein